MEEEKLNPEAMKALEAAQPKQSRTLAKQPDGRFKLVDTTEVFLQRNDLVKAKEDLKKQIDQRKRDIAMLEAEIVKVDAALAE